MNAFEHWSDFGFRDAILRMEARHAAFDRFFDQISSRMHADFFGYRVPRASEPREPRVLVEFPQDGEPPPARPSASGLEITEVLDSPPQSPEPRSSRVADLVEGFEPGRRRSSKESYEEPESRRGSKIFDVRIESPQEDADSKRRGRRRSSTEGRVSNLIQGFDQDRCDRVLEVLIEPTGKASGSQNGRDESRSRVGDLIKGFDHQQNAESKVIHVQIESPSQPKEVREVQGRVSGPVEGFDHKQESSRSRVLDVRIESTSGGPNELQGRISNLVGHVEDNSGRTRVLDVRIEGDDPVEDQGHSVENFDSPEDMDRRGRRVGFCKTEVHYVPGSGRVNIVDTDEKPPPTQLYRRRRRRPVPKVIFDSRNSRGPDKENSNTIIHHFSIESVSGVRHNSASANLFRPITPVVNPQSVSVGASFMHEPKAKRAETSHVTEKALGHVSPKLQSLLKNSMMADFGVAKTSTVSKSVTRQQFTSDSSETKRSSKSIKSESMAVKREDSLKGKSSSTRMKTAEESKRTRVLQESNMINGNAKKSLENGKSKTESVKTINIKISNDNADKKKKNSFSVKGIVMVVKDGDTKSSELNEKETKRSHRNKVHLNKSESFKSSPKFVQKQESFNANGTKIRVSTTVAKTPSMKTDSLRRKDSGEKSAFKPVVKKNSDGGDKMEKVLAAREKVAKKAQTYGKFVQTSERKSHGSESSQLTRSEAFTEKKSSASSTTGKISSRNSKNELDSLDRRRQSSCSPDGLLFVSSAAAVQRVTKNAMDRRRQSSESSDRKLESSTSQYVSTRQASATSEFRTTENRRRQSSEEKKLSTTENVSKKTKKSDSRSPVDSRPSSSSPERKMISSSSPNKTKIDFHSSEDRRSSEDCRSSERKMLSSETISSQRKTSEFKSEERRRLSGDSQDGNICTTKKKKSEVSKNQRESSRSPDGKTTEYTRRQPSVTPERTSYVIKNESSSDRRKQSSDRKSVVSSARSESIQKVVKSDSSSSVNRGKSRDSPDRKGTSVSSKATANQSFTIDSLGDSSVVSSIVRRLEAPSPFMNKDLLRRSFRRESTLVNSILGSQEENRALFATGPRDGTINFSETTLVSPFIMKGAARHSLRSTPTSRDSGSESDNKTSTVAASNRTEKASKTKTKEQSKEKVLKSRHSSDAVVSSKTVKSEVKTRSSSSNEIISDQRKSSHNSKKEESHSKENLERQFDNTNAQESSEKVFSTSTETRRSSVLSESAQNISKLNAKERISETNVRQSQDFVTREQEALAASTRGSSNVETCQAISEASHITSNQLSNHQLTNQDIIENLSKKSSHVTKEEKSRVKNMVAEITDSTNKTSKTLHTEDSIMQASTRSVAKQNSDQNLKVKNLIHEFSSIEASTSHSGERSVENEINEHQDQNLSFETSRRRSSDVSAVEDKQKRISAGTVKGLVQERYEMFENKAKQSGEEYYESSPVRSESRRDSVLSESSEADHIIERHTGWNYSQGTDECRRSKESLAQTAREIVKQETQEVGEKVTDKRSSKTSKKERSDNRNKDESNSVRRELFPEDTKRQKNDGKRSSSSHLESKTEETVETESIISKRRKKGNSDQEISKESGRRSSEHSNGEYGMIQKRRDSKYIDQSASGETSKCVHESSHVSSKSSKRRNVEEFSDQKFKIMAVKNQGETKKQNRKKVSKQSNDTSHEYGHKNGIHEGSSQVSKTRSKGHSVIQQPAISATSVIQESTRISSGRVSRHRNETVTYSVDRLGDSPEYATPGASEHRDKVREVTERLSRRGDDARRGKEPLRSFEKISNGWVEGNVQEHTRSNRAVVTTSSQSTASQLSAGSKCIEEITNTSS